VSVHHRLAFPRNRLRHGIWGLQNKNGDICETNHFGNRRRLSEIAKSKKLESSRSQIKQLFDIISAGLRRGNDKAGKTNIASLQTVVVTNSTF
jgi:hypothetical protein